MSDEQSLQPTDIQVELHDFRKKIDACIQVAESFLGTPEKSVFVREMSLVRTKLQEAKMWIGKCLEVWGSELPKEFQDKAE